MTGILYAVEAINETTRVAGIGGKMRVNVVFVEEGKEPVAGVYHGKLVGLFVDVNGEGHYRFEDNQVVKADKQYFTHVEPTLSPKSLPDNRIFDPKINRTTFN